MPAAFPWPALPDRTDRQQLLARIDAVVAHAYDLTRAQYAHVLASFAHTSAPELPGLCLSGFDELAQEGIDAFVRRHDPYADVPRNDQLPQPVLRLFPSPVDHAEAPWRDPDGQTSFITPSAGLSDAAVPDASPLSPLRVPHPPQRHRGRRRTALRAPPDPPPRERHDHLPQRPGSHGPHRRRAPSPS